MQRLKGDGNTFAEIADALMAMVLRGASSKQIDVVFDVYRERSIKNTERERRGCRAGNEYRNLQPEHRVRQWRKFLSNPQNKKQLIGFINQEWKKEKFRQRLNGITLLVPSEETCTEICEDGVRPREDLRSTQEEADTRLLLHALHAARNGYRSVVISSEDTDVFILCLAFKSFIPATIYVKCGTQARTRYISITQVVERHGSRLCRCLPGLHAFTGCDSASAFSGKGKLTALKLARQNPSIQELFQRVGMAWEVSEELFMELQQFTCTMYAPNSGTDDVNLLRYRLFCAKKGDIDSRLLPPCQDTLRKHCQRANYQAAVWRRSLQNSPVLPSPIGNGWFMKGECLALDWRAGI